MFHQAALPWPQRWSAILKEHLDWEELRLYQTDQAFVEEFVNWFTGENRQFLNPAGPPYIRHWQALP